MNEPFERQRKFNLQYVDGTYREDVDCIVMRERKDKNQVLLYVIDTGQMEYFEFEPIENDAEIMSPVKESDMPPNCRN
ncbi:hypothetical protein C4577_03000 [Candidatus Parcubacteria bacterium]|nr:MAG: hypothetical protein C4577_03000 [Candidatus Parcubacteria bacterium]